MKFVKIHHSIGKELNFPEGVEKLHFKHFTLEGHENVIEFPESILELELSINYGLEFIVFPKFLRKLTLGGYFNSSVKDANFPQTLTHLTFNGAHFDQDVRNANFPKSLIYLEFNIAFNQPIKDANFPSKLRRLILGYDFNQDIRNANLPEGLVQLNLGVSFNHPIKDANLPKSLKVFIIEGTFGKVKFNHPIKDANLPKSLKQFRINGMDLTGF